MIILLSVINLNRMSDSVKIRIFVNRGIQSRNFFKVITLQGNYCREMIQRNNYGPLFIVLSVSFIGSHAPRLEIGKMYDSYSMKERDLLP